MAIMDQTEKGDRYELLVGQEISKNMVISKAFMILVKTAMFNKDIREWSRMNKDEKTWKNSRFFQWEHQKIQKTTTTSGI